MRPLNVLLIGCFPLLALGDKDSVVEYLESCRKANGSFGPVDQAYSDAAWNYPAVATFTTLGEAVARPGAILKHGVGYPKGHVGYGYTDFEGNLILRVDWAALGFDPSEVFIENGIHPDRIVALEGNELNVETSSYVYEFIGIRRIHVEKPALTLFSSNTEDRSEIVQTEIQVRAAIDRMAYDLDGITWILDKEEFNLFDDQLLVAYNFDQVDLDPGVVGCDRVVYDISKYGRTGLMNHAAFTSGKFNDAIRFGDVEDYLVGPSALDLNFNGEDKTIFLWIKTDESENDGHRKFIFCLISIFFGLNSIIKYFLFTRECAREE